MKEEILSLFREHAQLAILISIGISILIALAGILPSVFLTAANVLFFGFWNGAAISFAGEALGALVAFYVYRKGFKERLQAPLHHYPRLEQLVNAEGRKAFLLIFSLRLIPFVPSGLVTFAAATGRVRTGTFLLASSLGKIPALLMEAYAVYQVTNFGWQGKAILTLIALVLLYRVLKHMRFFGNRSS